jgi:hypothetical protein
MKKMKPMKGATVKSGTGMAKGAPSTKGAKSAGSKKMVPGAKQ